MTPEEINTAIAGACGWKRLDVPQSALWGATPTEPKTWWYAHQLSNYCGDLNAMHEAEKVLTEKQQVWYLQKLTQVRYRAGVGGMIGCMIDKTTFATAAQRAEAFLRTLGKWEEVAK